MVVYIYEGGQRKPLTDPAAYIGPARVPVQTIHAYTGGQRHLVWSRSPVALAAAALSPSSIRLTWTAPGAVPVDSYKLYRGSSLLYSGTALTRDDTGLAASTRYDYRIDAIRSGVVMSTATASATTQAPQYQQKVATLTAVETASYNSGGGNRGSSSMYFGYYSSIHGTQKSQYRVAVPADLRNCVSVDKVEVSIMGRHTYPNAGTTVTLVVHHNTSLSGSYGGSTGGVTTRSIGKPGWFGGSEWADVTTSSSAGRYTVAEEFRAHGAQGFGLATAGSGQSYYGYADGSGGPTVPRVRFTYTVRVA